MLGGPTPTPGGLSSPGPGESKLPLLFGAVGLLLNYGGELATKSDAPDEWNLPGEAKEDPDRWIEDTKSAKPHFEGRSKPAESS